MKETTLQAASYDKKLGRRNYDGDCEKSTILKLHIL